ncbi:hypothetical protein N7461_005646 [Penicillium sp. DV-2018c]|nr:hypothetical protein N7461_005646 [Penicillium sp. DV-2018c]
MKFTGFTISLALAGSAYSAALPPSATPRGTVGGAFAGAANLVAPVTSSAGVLTHPIKRGNTEAIGQTIQAVPGIVNGPIDIAGSAVGTGESLVSGAAYTAENAIGGAAGAAKRDNVDAIGQTLQTVPSTINSPIAIVGSAIGTGESLASGAAYTAENAIGGAGPATKRDMDDIVDGTVGQAGDIVGGLLPRQGLAGNLDAAILGAVFELTNNPLDFLSAIGSLKQAVNVGEITQGQLASLPALQHILALINL